MHLPGSALEGRAVFEGEGQAAIRVGCGVVQKATPELFAEGGDLAVLLLGPSGQFSPDRLEGFRVNNGLMVF